MTGGAFISDLGDNLRSYRVSSNQLSGTIAETLPATLQELWVASNLMTGTIPASIGSMANLGEFERAGYVEFKLFCSHCP